MSFDKIELTTGLLHKIKLYIVYGKTFFSYSKCTINFEMPQNSFWSISFFYFNCFSDDVLSKIAIWADGTAVNWSCDKPSDFSQQVEIAYELWFDLKIWKFNSRNITEIILYLEANWYWLKIKNINSPFFISPIIK